MTGQAIHSYNTKCAGRPPFTTAAFVLGKVSQQRPLTSDPSDRLIDLKL